MGESLETGMRAKVRGDVWVNRLTAGRDMIRLRNWREKRKRKQLSKDQKSCKNDPRRGGEE